MNSKRKGNRAEHDRGPAAKDKAKARANAFVDDVVKKFGKKEN